MGEWSASHLGRALPPGKGPPVPIVQEAGSASKPVWTQRLEEKSFAFAGSRPASSLTELPQLFHVAYISEYNLRITELQTRIS
jgi:hypothetical protein